MLPVDLFPNAALVITAFLPPFWNWRNFLSVCMVISSVVPAADFFPVGLGAPVFFWAPVVDVTDFLPFFSAVLFFAGVNLSTLSTVLETAASLVGWAVDPFLPLAF